jgi:hypothetical protein
MNAYCLPVALRDSEQTNKMVERSQLILSSMDPPSLSKNRDSRVFRFFGDASLAAVSEVFCESSIRAQ